MLKVSLPLLAVVLGTVAVTMFSGSFGGIPSSYVRVGHVQDIRRADIVSVPARRVYVEANGLGFLALSWRTPGLGARVGFCRSSQWFEDPISGSKFSREGEYRLGPAQRGLDRYPVIVRGDVVYFDSARLIEGPKLGVQTSGGAPAGPFCIAAAPWGKNDFFLIQPLNG